MVGLHFTVVDAKNNKDDHVYNLTHDNKQIEYIRSKKGNVLKTWHKIENRKDKE